MAALEILVFFFYVFWLLFSALAQGETHLNDRIRGLDIFGLIPNFRFFCPAPVRFDYHLYYRSEKEEGIWSPWQELTFGNRHPAVCFIWNPGKRERKIFSRSVKAIRKIKQKKINEPQSVLYQLVRNYVSLHDKAGLHTQFKITHKQNLVEHAEEKTLYISHVFSHQ
jgi:hypothetical protein